MNASKRYQGDFSSLVSEPDTQYQSSNIAPVNEYVFSKLLFGETVKVYKIRGAQVLLYEGTDLGRCMVNAQGKIIHHEKSNVNTNLNFAVVEDEFQRDAEKYLRG